MGADFKPTVENAPLQIFTSVEDDPALVAQIAHPSSWIIDTTTAEEVLTQVSADLHPSVRVIVTGGGFLTLEYPRVGVSPRVRRRPDFLDELRAWTHAQVVSLAGALRETSDREFLIGVDVRVEEQGSGQFGLWVGRDETVLVSKRFPVGHEEEYLAGVDTTEDTSGPRIVRSSLGRVMILVCHDAQAFNHRNLANVGRAQRTTRRSRAAAEIARHIETNRPSWVFDLIHWIGGDANLRTFRTSFKQIHEDRVFGPIVVGAFGYEDGAETEATGWLAKLRHPAGASVVPVLIEME